MAEVAEQESFDQEFDDLIGGLDDQQQEPVEEEPAVEEETTAEEPVEEPTAEEEEQAVEEEPAAEEEPTDGPLDEAAELRQQNELLQKRIEELSGQVIYGGYSGQSTPPSAPQPQSGTDDGPKAQQQPQVQPSQQAAQPPNFLEGVDLENLYENPQVLNEVLSRVHGAATEHGARMAAERVLRQVPELVVGYVSRHTAMTNMVNDFYRENPDLTNVKQTVAAVANDLHAKNPDWDADKIFQETAGETRKLLGLKKEAQQQARQASGKKPAFAGQRGTRRQEPKVTGLQKEINDLISEEF